jgi:hypothetical protein
MKSTSFFKAGILMLVLVSISLISWESYLRHKGLKVDFDDNESLWSDKRAMVYEPSDRATVFIGSSRIKFDLDIPTWESITGDQAIQLSIVGSSPRPVLENLAADPKFKGKLIIDVTEVLFFLDAPFANATPNQNIAYYKKETPSQKFSFLVNKPLESSFVMLDQGNFSTSAMLDELPIPDRPGVPSMPIFPIDFERVSFDRQSSMTPRFVADTVLQNEVKAIWVLYGKRSTGPPPSGDTLMAIINSVKTCVDKIRARGGQVLFTRTPSSGHFLQMEQKGFPREKYWDRLLAVTGCPGIYFEDYPAISHFTCPEGSHLVPSDAVIYTKNLVGILEKEKGWSFPQKPVSR